jgi:hypothetical protein
MARIIAVHGIGQQTNGSESIHDEWWPELCDGLKMAKYNLQDKSDLVCPFYGYLFRKPSTLLMTETKQFEDNMSFHSDEELLLELLWDEAQKIEPHLNSCQEQNSSVESLRVPEPIQDILLKLAKCKFFANFVGDIPKLIKCDVEQVVRYVREPKIRQAAREAVLEKITDETKVVIGHSLGSVVAYEALCQQSNNVVSFISLGSPLGIPNLIFDKLEPSPINQKGIWPGKVKYWTNISEKGDLVALVKKLGPSFGDELRKVKDISVDNGSDAHSAENYLTTSEIGEAIRTGLCS